MSPSPKFFRPFGNRLGTCSQLAAMLTLCLLATGTCAQEVNPLVGDVRAERAGAALFRAQCATCHGADGRGIQSIDAPDLTLLWSRPGVADASVFATIRQGVPGTIMPAHDFTDTETWMLVSYLHSIAAGEGEALPDGNSSTGQVLFAQHCSRCHRAGSDNLGGSLGPRLSGIINRRSLASVLQSVREPDAARRRGYKTVRLQTETGEFVTGVIKSEDAFSLQIMSDDQRLRAYAKNQLLDLQRLPQSLMPAFSEAQLSRQQLIDIIHYLQSG